MTDLEMLVPTQANSGYYNYWKGLLTIVNLTTNNSFWSNTRINVS